MTTISRHSLFTFARIAAAALVGLTSVSATAMNPAPSAPLASQAQLGAGISYQGRLVKSGSPQNGSCDFQFKLWDAASGGAQLGATQTVTGVVVASGLFATSLNSTGQFGLNAFSGSARWLETAVKCAGDGGYTTLTPRSALNAVPFAHSLRPGAVISNAAAGTMAMLATDFEGLSAQSPNYGVSAYGGPGYAGVFGGNENINSVGVYGTAYQYGSRGVSGEGADAGVYGLSTNGSGIRAKSTTGNGVTVDSAGWVGVAVVTSTWRGVYAFAATDGVYGVGGPAYSGVYGSNDNINSIGVKGVASAAGAVGVWGESTANTGVYGLSTNGRGVWGASTTSYAGYFQGNALVTGNLSKGGGSFKIDHPLDPANKYLYHSFVESPDMMNIYNGNVTTDDKGFAEVGLPAWFEALNRDYRYQLTVVGQFAQAIVAREVEKNTFVIQTDKPKVKVSWQVTGIRKDPYANAHRIPVEEPKPADERGRYLHPDAYGKPETMSIDYARAPANQAASARP